MADWNVACTDIELIENVIVAAFRETTQRHILKSHVDLKILAECIGTIFRAPKAETEGIEISTVSRTIDHRHMAVPTSSRPPQPSWPIVGVCPWLALHRYLTLPTPGDPPPAFVHGWPSLVLYHHHYYPASSPTLSICR